MLLGVLEDGYKHQYHCKPPVAIVALNFSKLVSKFWKLLLPSENMH